MAEVIPGMDRRWNCGLDNPQPRRREAWWGRCGHCTVSANELGRVIPWTCYFVFLHAGDDTYIIKPQPTQAQGASSVLCSSTHSMLG